MALPKPQRTTKDFAKHPAGMTPLVLVDIVGPWMRANEWPKGSGIKKPQQRIALIWQSQEIRPDDELHGRFELNTQHTYSVHENATLPKFLGGVWPEFVVPATAEEALTHLDDKLGTTVLGNVVHKPGDGGKVYVNIASLAPLIKGMAPLTAVGYTRAKFWTDKLADDAAGLAAWEQEKLAAQVTGAANASKAKSPDPVGSFDDFPAPLQVDPDEELPF